MHDAKGFSLSIIGIAKYHQKNTSSLAKCRVTSEAFVPRCEQADHTCPSITAAVPPAAVQHSKGFRCVGPGGPRMWWWCWVVGVVFFGSGEYPECAIASLFKFLFKNGAYTTTEKLCFVKKNVQQIHKPWTVSGAHESDALVALWMGG